MEIRNIHVFAGIRKFDKVQKCTRGYEHGGDQNCALPEISNEGKFSKQKTIRLQELLN